MAAAHAQWRRFGQQSSHRTDRARAAFVYCSHRRCSSSHQHAQERMTVMLDYSALTFYSHSSSLETSRASPMHFLRSLLMAAVLLGREDQRLLHSSGR